MAEAGSSKVQDERSWVQKYQGTDGKHTLRLSSSWKKRYAILLRHGSQAHVLYYDKKPKTLQDPPKGRIPLISWFTVQKKQQFRGQNNVCEIATATSKLLHLALEEEKVFHLLTFFLQTQIQLREAHEHECFVVRPDGSNEHMKLGSRGSICLLHISQGGVTLALQLSRCVLTQWPLNCIKLYESTERGQFILDIGQHAPTGPGKFVFNTRHEDNNRMYDILDKYVMELAGLKQLAASRSSAQSITMEKLIEQQYSALESLVQPRSDPRFISHLKKVSRGIYDQLAEHLGVTSNSRTEISPAESSEPPPMMRFTPKRSNSQQGARPKEPIPQDTFPSMSLGRHPKKLSPVKIPNSAPKPAMNSTPTALESQTAAPPTAQLRTKPPKQSPLSQKEPTKAASSVDSQYLDMGSPSKKLTDSAVFDKNRYVKRSQMQAPERPVYKNVHDTMGEVVSPAAASDDSQYLRMSGTDTSPESNLGNSFLSDKASHRDSPNSSYNPYSKAKSSMHNLHQLETAAEPYLQPTTQVVGERHSHPNGYEPNTVSITPDRAPANRSNPTNGAVSQASLLRPQSLPEARGSIMYEDMSGGPSPLDHRQASPRRSLGPPMPRFSTFYEDMAGSPNANIAPKGQAVSPSLEHYEDMGDGGGYWGDGSVRPKSRRQVTSLDHVPLRRQHSRSCEDLVFGQYSQVLLEGQAYENDVSGLARTPSPVNNQIYSYARPTDLDIQLAEDSSHHRPTKHELANFERMIQRMPTVRDKHIMYSRPIPKHLRKSMSASNLLDLNHAESFDLQSVGAASFHNGSIDTPNVRKLSGNRPPNFDFSKLNKRHSQDAAVGEIASPTDPIYKTVGNSKFWNSSIEETPSPIIATTPTMKGVAITEQTRVFSRINRSPEKQSTPVDILRASDGSMRGRRLPSLPPGAKLPLEGTAGVKGTLC